MDDSHKFNKIVIHACTKSIAVVVLSHNYCTSMKKESIILELQLK